MRKATFTPHLRARRKRSGREKEKGHRDDIYACRDSENCANYVYVRKAMAFKIIRVAL